MIRPLTAVLVAALAVTLGACSDDGGELHAPEAARPTTTAVADEQYTSTVAEATVPEVPVFGAPGGAAPDRTIEHPQPSGAPLVFLVIDEQGDWLHVHLPVRPNGSTGWIRASDVALTEHDYRIVVELAAHRITVTKGPEIVLQEPVAVGRQDTPTPGGHYYIKELIRPPNPNTVYGPYAYGLSGFSNVLTEFMGGEGVIGIHGNNDPSVLGQDVSAGCIRMSNEGITRLVEILPLGTPVEIRP